MPFYLGRHVVSARDFDRETLLTLFRMASSYKHILLQRKNIPTLQQTLRLNGPLYFQILADKSTRTVSSFEKAIWTLGGTCSTLPLQFSSVYKDESLSSTAVNLSARPCDAIIVRHDQRDDAAEDMACAIEEYGLRTRVINAGCGSKEHPTQMLLDLFTIDELFMGRFERGELSYALIGDLSHSRTIHSLLIGLSHFGGTVYLVGPTEKNIPEWLEEEVKDKITLIKTADLWAIAPYIHIAYFTRVQNNLGSMLSDSAMVEYPKKYGLTDEFRALCKEKTYFLHPQPCGPEFNDKTDLRDPRAVHNKQSWNGVPVRMALLYMLFRPLQ